MSDKAISILALALSVVAVAVSTVVLVRDHRSDGSGHHCGTFKPNDRYKWRALPFSKVLGSVTREATDSSRASGAATVLIAAKVGPETE
jgi:hypothetical protein